MKKITAIATLTTLLITQSYAGLLEPEQKTVVGKSTQIYDNEAYILGVKGSTSMDNDHFYFGGGAMTIPMAVDVVNPLTDAIQNLFYFQSMIYMGVSLFPHSILDLALETSFGPGIIMLFNNGPADQTDMIFVGETELNVILRLSDSFHFSFGGSYRSVGSAGMSPISKQGLEGYSLNMGLVFKQ